MVESFTGLKALLCLAVVVLLLDYQSTWARKTTSGQPARLNSVHRRGDETRINSADIQCQDQDGRPIKWFVAYKLAKIYKAGNKNIRSGIGYVYLTPTSGNEWTLARDSVNDSTSLPGRTIQRLFSYESGGDTLSVIYNDQPPVGPFLPDGGHAKGIVIANENGGIWLQHSVPKFPPPKSKYSYPPTGTRNGQVFFCMTLSKEQLDSTVPGVLSVTAPNIYNYTFPSNLSKVYPTLFKLVSKRKLRKPRKKGQRRGGFIKDNSAVFNMTIDKDVVMTIFAKSPAHHTDVYADWIAPTLNSGLEVQSWLNGPNPLPSNCTLTSHIVKNIMNKTVEGYGFTTHVDHSKWAVGNETEWMCISDLNRMKHQEMRGGATFCFKNLVLWENFRKGVINLQPCGGGKLFSAFLEMTGEKVFILQ